MRAPRTSALTISTRCCSPTERSLTNVSQPSARPYFSPMAVDARPHACLVQHAPAPALAHHEVFQHRVPRHQMKVLMHHADAGRQRIGGGVDDEGFTADADAAGVGGIQSEQDIHQRGLAGAILAEQAQHLTGPQRQIDGAIGMHVAKALVDSAHFQQRRQIHEWHFLRGQFTGVKAGLNPGDRDGFLLTRFIAGCRENRL